MIKRALTLASITVLGAALGLAVWTARAPRPDQLLGLWRAEEAWRGPGDAMHFYYFHKGGKGLYRYGQIGHNATHSFDWRLEGDRLVLLFRKAGERATTRVAIVEENGRRVLELADDPRATQPTRYRFVPPNLSADLDAEATGGPLALPDGEPAVATATPAAMGGRMWIDLRRYATGGMGYSMYQLSEHPAQAGWKIGWHHRGDFDDWTTELLVYRVDGGAGGAALRLHFLLRDQAETTPAALSQDRGRRLLTLERDPRDFYARARFVDAGPSF